MSAELIKEAVVSFLLVECHTIFREALKKILTTYFPQGKIVGEAENGSEALRLAETLKPDLIITALSIPKPFGFEVIKEIKKKNPSQKFLVLTTHQEMEYILVAFRVGANGYAVKTINTQHFIFAVQSVLEGSSFLSPEITDQIIEDYLFHARLRQRIAKEKKSNSEEA